MKKFICALVSVFCLLPFGLTACSNSSSDNGIIDLAECEIGYELPVYPNCEFDYVLTKYSYTNGVYTAIEYTVHISSIKITLASINEIQPNETLDSEFSRYVLNLNAYGTTDKVFAGKTLSINFYRSDYGSTLVGYNSEIISEDGTIIWNKKINVSEYVSFSFAQID